MSRLVVRTLVAAALACTSLSSALAQKPITAKNPERRLPPAGSQATDIPAGVDTGTPATSSALPLGTPVPPAVAADRSDQNKRSAAARAAAKPNRRLDCGSAATAKTDAAVALPGSGFLGSSASPATASAVARGTTNVAGC